MPFLPPEALADEASVATAARRAIALAKGGDTRAALGLALQARRSAQGHEMAEGEGQALNAAAIVHMIRGDSIAAVATALDAQELAVRVGDPSMRGHALVSLKMAAFNLGVAEGVVAALEGCVQEALARYDVGVEIRARAALGVVYGDSALFDSAQYEFTRALPLALTHHCSSTGPARIMANMANLQRKRAIADFPAFEARALHECSAAEHLARRARGMAQEEGNVAVEIDALAIRGCTLALRGEVAEARRELSSSIGLGRAARCPSAIAWVLCELGRLCIAAGDLDDARSLYSEAFEIASELRPSRKIAVACQGLADVEAHAGHVSLAMSWRERASDEAAAFEVARLQTRHLVIPA